MKKQKITSLLHLILKKYRVYAVFGKWGCPMANKWELEIRDAAQGKPRAGNKKNAPR